MWPPVGGYFCAIILGIMVRILTKDYTELDLTKGFEFQIEMENPMLEEDHIPSAFSTQISFPPSPVNRKVFGYTPAMFLAPNVKKLEASVWIGGVPFVSGTLVYDGIEDGCLMYTFTEKVVDLEGKIWEKSILKFYNDSVPSGSAKFSTPLLINKSNVAVQPYSIISRIPVSGEPGCAGATTGKLSKDDYLYRQKYFNYVNDSESFSYQTFIPAIPLRVILAGCTVEIPDGMLLRSGWAELSILGRYHEYLFDDVAKPNRWRDTATSGTTTSLSGNRKPSTGKPTRRGDSSSSRRAITDLASFLPDVSFAELIKDVCSMFCSTVFIDGETFRLIENTDVIESSSLEDWDQKVSDDFSSEEESAMSYKFGFGDDGDSSDSTKLTQNLNDGSIEAIQEGNVEGILAHFTSKEDYTVVFDESTGDVYSGRKYDGVVRRYYNSSNGAIIPVTETAYECDVIYKGAQPVENKVDADDTFNNSSDFLIAGCVPEKIFYSDTNFPRRMVAIIEPHAADEERDRKVYIGISYEEQFFCNGVFSPVSRTDSGFVGTEDLTPGGLWNKYHKAFAEWLGKTRQRVSVDVNLSPIDLHNFRLYRPVYFKGRKWIVAKLSVTVAAGSEVVSTRGEFIEI